MRYFQKSKYKIISQNKVLWFLDFIELTFLSLFKFNQIFENVKYMHVINTPGKRWRKKNWHFFTCTKRIRI